MAKIIGGVTATPLKIDGIKSSLATIGPKVSSLESTVGSLSAGMAQKQNVINVTAADNGKVLTVDSNGKIVAVAVKDSAVKTYVDEYISSALEGEY